MVTEHSNRQQVGLNLQRAQQVDLTFTVQPFEVIFDSFNFNQVNSGMATGYMCIFSQRDMSSRPGDCLLYVIISLTCFCQQKNLNSPNTAQ